MTKIESFPNPTAHPTDMQVALALNIVAQIRAHLAGHPAEVQSAAIADLLALFLAGHHPDVRGLALDMHLALVRELTAHNAKISAWGR